MAACNSEQQGQLASYLDMQLGEDEERALSRDSIIIFQQRLV